MPLKSPQKVKILEKLHAHFNRLDEYPAEPGRSLEFSEQVKSDMAEIIAAGLHANITGWGMRCSEAREACGYKQEHVAEMLEVDHRIIQRHEEANALTDIDLYYLEAFSLIYRVSPYFLLGLGNPHAICPFTSPNNRASIYSDIIMTTLFQIDNPNKLDYLKALIQIGKLKQAKYKKLMSYFMDTSTFSQIFEKDPLASTPQYSQAWRDDGILLLGLRDGCDPAKYAHRQTYWEAHLLLNHLERYNPIRLYTLVQFALCDDQTAHALKTMILDFGYPKNLRSLHNYHVDKLLNPRPKRKKKKATPGDEQTTTKKSDANTEKPNDSTEKPNDSTEKTDDSTEKTEATTNIPTINTTVQASVFYLPNRSLSGILEDGQLLIHNGDARSSIYGYSARLSDFLLTVDYETLDQSNEGDAHQEPSTQSESDMYRIDLRSGHIFGPEGKAMLTPPQLHDIKQIIQSIFLEGVYRDALPMFQPHPQDKPKKETK